MVAPAVVVFSVLGFIIVNLVTKVLFAFGIGYTTFNGFNTLLDSARGRIESAFSILPPEVLQVMGLMNIDIYINIVLSAISIKFALKGVTAAGTLVAFSLAAPELGV